MFSPAFEANRRGTRDALIASLPWHPNKLKHASKDSFTLHRSGYVLYFAPLRIFIHYFNKTCHEGGPAINRCNFLLHLQRRKCMALFSYSFDWNSQSLRMGLIVIIIIILNRVLHKFLEECWWCCKRVRNISRGTSKISMQEKEGDNFSRARESVLSILDLAHTVVYDTHNVCILVKEDKLKEHEAPDTRLQSNL